MRIAIFGIMLAFACLSAHARTTESTTKHTARDMWHLYYDTHPDCGSATAPEFLCTGIIIRVTKPGPGYYSWRPSPEDIKTGRVSFSYLRKDAKFGYFKSGATSGFTLYPLRGPYKGPANKLHLDVLCAYPMDGWTDHRKANGCGSSGRYPTQSVPCQQQKIYTAQQWISHWNAGPASPYNARNLYQCGFDVREGSPYKDTTAAFHAMIQSMQLLGSTSFSDHNELVISAWPANTKDADLPIQSFFYAVKGSAPGGTALSDAQKDQRNYFNLTHIFVPIVRINIPATQNDDFDFHFVPSDQAVPIPN